MASGDAQIQDLQRRVQRMQGAAVSRRLPSLSGLTSLLTLRTGAAYGVDSASLALALLAGPSQAGEWAAIVGATDLGFEAAAGWGLDLARTIVVPHPGEHWLSVTAGLIDVATVVLVRPPVPVSEQQAEKLRSRLRQKDATLVCWGSWPRCEARLSVRSSVWTGLGQGHGRLQDGGWSWTWCAAPLRGVRWRCGCPVTGRPGRTSDSRRTSRWSAPTRSWRVEMTAVTAPVGATTSAVSRPCQCRPRPLG